MITSLENKTVKELCKLHLKKYRKEAFLILDEQLILLAKQNNHLIQLIYTDELPFEFDNTLCVSKEVLNKIAQQDNLKYIGVSKMIEEKDTYRNRVLILDDLQDPLNIAKIMEGCLLFGFDSIILSENCADIYNEKCIRDCKGGIYLLNIKRCDIINEIERLKKDGFKVYATGLSNNTRFLNEIDTQDKMAFVLGNEGSGVSKKVMDISDEVIKIDMCNIDSLNVAMAASIVMYNFSI